jgi:predicted extracellular nuclease
MKQPSQLLHALVLLALLLGAGFPFSPSAAAPDGSPNLVISHLYTFGGDSGAIYKFDFIEIYNRGNSPVSLKGLTLQYASATGAESFGATPARITPLPDTSLSPRQYFLVREGSGGSVGALLPAEPDVTDDTPINMAGSDGKIAIINSTAPLGCNSLSTCSPAQLALIVDLVGYGSTNFFEGDEPVHAPTNTTSLYRLNDGDQDTDSNINDFASSVPNPRNSFYIPAVSITSPAGGATDVPLDSIITLTFNKPVTVSDPWFAITCASGVRTANDSGGPQSYTLDPVAEFGSEELCTVTIDADKVVDVDSRLLHKGVDYAWSFTTASTGDCGDPALPIHSIQGSGSASPQDGFTRTIEGIVTGAYTAMDQQRGFYVQNEATIWDADPATSEGIFVYHPELTVTIQAGDLVRVTGEVDEYHGLTELTNAEVTVCSQNNPLPPPHYVAMPFPDTGSGAPYLEQFEGMRVALSAGKTVTELYTLGRGGEFWLTHGERLWNPTNVVAPGPAAVELQAQNDRNRILVDDGSTYSQNPSPLLHPSGGLSLNNRVRIGDMTSKVITGVLGYGRAVWDINSYAYRLHADIGAEFEAVNNRPAAALDNGRYLTVASFNVLSYFNGDGQGGGFNGDRGASDLAEFNRQRAKVIHAIHSLDADVIGLMELEDDGFGQFSAIRDLVNGLNALAGAGTYAFVNPGLPEVGGDVITVGILYKPAVVSLERGAQVLNTGAFQQGPGRLHRVPIAQTFSEKRSNQRFTVVVNHFKSKGCKDADDNDATGLNADQGDGQGCWNAARLQAAEELIAWVTTDPTSSGDEDFLIMGDFNAYRMENPVTKFTDPLTSGGGGYLDLDGGSHTDYSYVFTGQSGRLDHIFASPSLALHIAGAYTYHINADEPPAFGYEDFNQAGLYADNVYRSADHDPTVVRLSLALLKDVFLPLAYCR